MNLEGKKVLVAGAGKSGIAAVELLKKMGISAILLEGNQNAKEEELRAKSEALKDISIVIGELPDEIADQIDILVLSPGIPTDLPWVNALREKGIAIWGEIELAYQCAKGRILAITGTNGKTTTTALLGEIMAHVFEDVKVVGNIGIPYTSVAADTTDETVTVAEISSFQLETAHAFAPAVSAILNITPDHLDRHHSMENYIAVKESITKNQGENEYCILNYEDEVLRRFGEQEAKTNVVFFSSKRELKEGYFLDGDQIFYAHNGEKELVIHVDDLNILGRHNYENVMAATAMAQCFGVSFEKIREVLVRFQAVEHRIEYVAEKRGVRYYNDSKGTNPDAAIQGIRAMNRPTVLIGGGYDKGASYEEWIEAFDGKVKKLVLLGQTREKIAETAHRLGFMDTVYAETLQEAVDICAETAESGDAVLLSPACASWGMFPNYEERGRQFKEMVHKIEE